MRWSEPRTGERAWLCQSPGGVPARGAGALEMSVVLTQGRRTARSCASPEPGEQPVGPPGRDFDTALMNGAARAPVGICLHDPRCAKRTSDACAVAAGAGA